MFSLSENKVIVTNPDVCGVTYRTSGVINGFQTSSASLMTFAIAPSGSYQHLLEWGLNEKVTTWMSFTGELLTKATNLLFLLSSITHVRLLLLVPIFQSALKRRTRSEVKLAVITFIIVVFEKITKPNINFIKPVIALSKVAKEPFRILPFSLFVHLPPYFRISGFNSFPFACLASFTRLPPY